MKILHIGKYYSPYEGGIENFMSSLIKRMHTGGMDFIVHAHHHELLKPASMMETGPGNAVFRSFTLCRILFAPISPFFYFDLKALIDRFDPDLVHVHMPNLSAFWLLVIKKQKRPPIVVHWHADVVASRRQKLLSLAYVFYKPLETLLLKKADAIIVTSPSYLESSGPLRRWKDKCRVIPLAPDDPENQPAAGDGAGAHKGWRHPGAFKVLCIGRLTYYKGQKYLIEAVSELDNTELIIVGTGDYFKKYGELIDKLDVAGAVQLPGHATRTELDSLLESCDCFCLPSIERTEAFGLVLLEAMQKARPCVCTDVAGSGMSWVVQDGITGLVARAENKDSLKTALLRLRDDRNLAAGLGRAGYERYKASFTMDKVAEEVSALYNQLLGKK